MPTQAMAIEKNSLLLGHSNYEPQQHFLKSNYLTSSATHHHHYHQQPVIAYQVYHNNNNNSIINSNKSNNNHAVNLTEEKRRSFGYELKQYNGSLGYYHNYQNDDLLLDGTRGTYFTNLKLDNKRRLLTNLVRSTDDDYFYGGFHNDKKPIIAMNQHHNHQDEQLLEQGKLLHRMAMPPPPQTQPLSNEIADLNGHHKYYQDQQQQLHSQRVERQQFIHSSTENQQQMHPDGTDPNQTGGLPPIQPIISNGTTTTGKLFHRSHHYTQIIAALAISLGPLAAGLGKGYASPAIDSLQELHVNPRGNYTSFAVSDQEASWLASLSLLGALFGGTFGGLAMQHGRKRVLTVMSLPFSLSWILTVFAKSVQAMYVTAFLGGFCCSIIAMVTQVYVSEISSPEIRGFLSAIQKMAGHLGFLISFSLGAYLDWRQLALLVSIAPIMLFLTVIYIPETPSFLLLKGRDEEAYRSLQFLRGPNNNVEVELDTIRSNIRATRLNNLATNINNSSRHRFSLRSLRGTSSRSVCLYLSSSARSLLDNLKLALRNARLVKPVLITCGLMVFQRFTGPNSFNFYAVKIFRQTFAGMNPHGGAVAMGFVQLLASMLSGLLIDTVGRIPLLIISSVFMSLAFACLGSYIYYEQGTKVLATNTLDFDTLSNGGNTDWIPLLCVLIFTIAFSLGISPISSLLVGELFPLEYRAMGSSIATSFSFFCSFLSVKTFVDFQEKLGLHGVFWLYSGISCFGLIFVVTFVPETKGKDLDEMDPKFVQTLTINR